ncbi:heavy-metal-associated domain protein [Asticcacaulis biprosthecium C19]|uniref:Heavy-metal-associated domain protein n=1 Tax=Asticcacaulis biprosthecium C19 TaxID=715226 RepID=F4QFX3_9CAUL|nr:heavy-metal-associated domain-containing protein [Asticcacaulis biprosthecium]EGF93784.1 heavy-metal-associated domain protein [Asticcacaulis biprosthecium C19]
MKYHIETMVCGGCVRSVTKIAQNLDPTAKVEADVVERTVEISSDQTDEITKALALAGFEATQIAA